MPATCHVSQLCCIFLGQSTKSLKSCHQGWSVYSNVKLQQFLIQLKRSNSDVFQTSLIGTVDFFQCPLSNDTEFIRGSKSKYFYLFRQTVGKKHKNWECLHWKMGVINLQNSLWKHLNYKNNWFENWCYHHAVKMTSQQVLQQHVLHINSLGAEALTTTTDWTNSHINLLFFSPENAFSEMLIT